MRTCAKSNPRPSTPKNQKTLPESGILKKSIFCHRTQAPRDRKNTDAFPGLLKPYSRVPAQHPNISHPQPTHTFPEIQTHPPVQPGKNTKTRNEVNPTQENPWAFEEA